MLRLLVFLLAVSACASPARAEVGWLSPGAFSGLLDLRAADADGEKSWLDGGFGKTRENGDDPRLFIGEADLAWRPELFWDWRAVVTAQIQPDHDRNVYVGEAYLTYKPLPLDGLRASARVGFMYPPVSLENEGPFWTPTETITPSAINSWIGEEVKTVAAEATIRRDIAGKSIGATVAVFGFNDTAGSLLALRGWALDDVRIGDSDHFALPPLSPFVAANQQPAVTRPIEEVDHRPGVYGRLDWVPTDALALNAFYYDNRGDRQSQTPNDQYAWGVHFAEFGLRYDLDDKTRLLSQILAGNAQVAYVPPQVSVNTDFNAGYLLLSRMLKDDSITGRVDVFSTTDHAPAIFGLTQEHGWALTADYRKPFTPHVIGLVELMHVESNRPERFEVLGEPSLQSQTVAQAALRLSF